MKKLLLIAVLVVSSQMIFAQAPQDSIEIKRGVFRQNGKMLQPKQLLEITKSNPVAFEYMQKAKKNYLPATILGSIGGFGIGFPLGGLVAGRTMNWTVFGIGLGFVAVSIPFSSAYTKNAKNAVLTYNQGLQKTGYKKIFLENF